MEDNDDDVRGKAEFFKSKGNDAYNKKNFSSAIDFYTEGIKLKCKDEELQAKLYSNRAIAHFYLGYYEQSLSDATAATELQPTYLKAIERGANACMKMNWLDEAIIWCDKGLAIDKKNKKLFEFKLQCFKEQNKEGKTQKLQTETVEGTVSTFHQAIEDEFLHLGHSCFRVGNFTEAMGYYNQCLKISRDVGHKSGEGTAHNNLGNVFYSLDDFKNAIDNYNQSLRITKEVGDKSGEAAAYNNLGNVYYSMGDFQKAVDNHTLYLKMSQGAGDKSEEGRAYSILGSAFHRLGDFKSAINHYKCCLEISQEAADKRMEGSSYNGLGDAYYHLGDFEKARENYSSSLKIARKVSDRSLEGRAYGGLGSTLLGVGDFKKAKDCYDLQLKIAKEVDDKSEEQHAYENLGNAFRNLGDLKKAIDCYDLHLKIAKKMGDTSAEANAYGNLGNTFHRLGDFNKAINYYNLYLQFASKAKDRSGAEIYAYNNLGNAFVSLGDFEEATENYNLSLKIARKVGDRSGEQTAYKNLGNAFYKQRDFQNAIDNYTLCLKISREVGDKPGEGSSYGNLGSAFDGLGDFKNALENYDLCLKIADEAGDKSMKEFAYNSLGNAYYHLGDFEKARQNYNLGLKIAETVSDKSMEGLAYGGLGSVFASLGDFKKAIEYHNLHLTIAKETGDKSGEGNAYGNLGNSFRCLGDFEKAIEYQQRHAEIAREVEDRSGEGRAYGNLGNAFCNVRDFENAIKNYELRRGIAIELGDKLGEGNVCGNLGSAFFRLGELTKAKEYYDLHLKIAKEVGDRSGEGKAYYNLGSLCHRLREFDKAIQYHNLHLEIAKEVKDKFGEAQGYYGLGDVFESLNRLPKAFEYYVVSVRSFNNVRSLLESKDEWKINFRNEFHEAYTGLWRVLLKQGKIAEALVVAEEGRAQALTDLIKSQYAVQVKTSISDEQEVDEFKSLSCSPSSIVFQALHNGTVSFWVLGANGGCIQYRRKELDDPIALNDVTHFFQSIIENAYDETGVRSEFRCEDRFLDTLRDDPTTTTDETNSVKESLQRPPLQENSLHTLYKFLIEPIADLVQGNELIIAPDGPLWLVPYAALVDHSSNYLSKSFKIRLVPSLTTLMLITNCPEEPQSKSDALLVGDPWYEEVVEKKGKKRKPLLKQLPFSRKEVEMIGELLQVTPLIGKQATKNEVLARLSSAALVHIAAHGSMEAGEIALTPNPDRTSKVPKKEDYILTMADVLGVRLRARLVVLSCCHSAKGKIKAEGVVGIARAFLGAGARSVLVSLWAINDEATMEFMANFFHHLVEGESASQSLNQAMKRFRESDKYSSVKHWAPFVLVGDDVTLEFGEGK